jgi:hypothetical protein
MQLQGNTYSGSIENKINNEGRRSMNPMTSKIDLKFRDLS